MRSGSTLAKPRRGLQPPRGRHHQREVVLVTAAFNFLQGAAVNASTDSSMCVPPDPLAPLMSPTGCLQNGMKTAPKISSGPFR
jgi:hypothetical protein